MVPDSPNCKTLQEAHGMPQDACCGLGVSQDGPDGKRGLGAAESPAGESCGDSLQARTRVRVRI